MSNPGWELVALGDLAALGIFAVLSPGLSRTPFPSVAASTAAFLVLLVGGRLRTRLAPELGREAGRLVAEVALSLLIVSLVFGHSSLASLDRRIPVAVALVVAGRFVAYRTLHAMRRRRWLVERAVIVGGGQTGVRLAHVLEEHPEYGLEFAGVIDDVPPLAPVPWLGRLEQVWGIVANQHVSRLIVCFSTTTAQELVALLRGGESPNLEIFVVPRLFDLPAAHRSETEWLWDIPVVPMRPLVQHRPACCAKRALDITATSLLLPFIAPLLAVTALAVRLTSRGPVLFRQRRVGRGGQCFEILKFRSMQVNDECDVQWSVTDDQKVTPFGRLLRDTGLDELPQLINVLRGDMSLVGPRPERPYFVEQFEATISNYHHRHRVRPGVTGWAQIHGLHGDTSIEERVRFDNHYIEQWSLVGDLRILGATVFAVLRRTRRGDASLADHRQEPDVVSAVSRSPSQRTTYGAERAAATGFPPRRQPRPATPATRTPASDSSSQ